MTSYGYIIMIIVDSCMILFHFDCIMQLKKSYHIATNICSRESAATFGDLPDWLWKAFLTERWFVRSTFDPIISLINFIGLNIQYLQMFDLTSFTSPNNLVLITFVKLIKILSD